MENTVKAFKRNILAGMVEEINNKITVEYIRL
jgi:hypothetical protein